MPRLIFESLAALFIMAVFLLPNSVLAASDTIYVFYSNNCPHCAKEISFLDEWRKQDKSVDFKAYEVSAKRNNSDLLTKVGLKLNVNVNGVPFTVIGDKYIIGFNNDTTTGARIKNYVEICRNLECVDVVYNIINNIDVHSQDSVNSIPDTIALPWGKDLKIKSLSLPVLTIVIAALDGFNPCAMWVLIFLISLLLGMEDRKRMWFLGITFLITSAAVYFLFMAAWLKLLLFLGFVIWVRIGIGAVALGGGIINIREWWKNKAGVCKVTGSEKRKKIFGRLKEITTQKSFILSLFGMILLAFAVNLVELICSAGLPAVYTQVLAMADLSSWQYYFYLLLYILIFLIDDILIFVIAMVTLQITGISTKYSRYSSLIGGMLMLIIGVLLILKPEWLMFG